MKKTVLLLAACALSMMSVRGETTFELEAGAEVVSDYLWRGQTCGGLSFQPDVTLKLDGNFGRFDLDLWGNIGGVNSDEDDDFATSKKFGLGKTAEFAPELDVTLSYSIKGFTVGLTHYHYFDRSWFDMDNELWAEGNQLEGFLKYTISDDLPLSFGWYTILSGTDGKLDGSSLKRAYSTYVEVGYDFSLPADQTLNITLGFSPWSSMYTGYDKNFAINNLSARLERERSLWNETATLTVFAQPMFNFYDASDFQYGKNFMWAIGCGLWF